MTRKFLYLILFVPLLWGCSEFPEKLEVEDSQWPNITHHDEPIHINTFRQIGNEVDVPAYSFSTTRSSDNEFEEIREVESYETVVLPSLASHIWLGNVIGKKSAINADYLPLAYNINPINVTTSLPPNYPSGTIEQPTLQSMYRFISQNVLSNATFTQNDEFKFSISQFTSYSELKETFGNNVNTSLLFWGNSSGESNNKETISKTTGFYAKFYQTSFTMSMDYPRDGIASDLRTQDMDSAVYVNSIAFGRLGILTLETNTIAEEAKRHLNSSFNTIFTSGQSYLTQEQKNFLEGCDFKLFLISGNGKTSVESFHGYTGFVDHISKGQFSREQPGSPIYCTFAYAKDNSPFKAVFKYSIKKEPIYVEIVAVPENKDSGREGKHKIYLDFFSSRAKVKVIPPKYLKFNVLRICTTSGDRPSDSGRIEENFSVTNTTGDTRLLIRTEPYLLRIRRDGSPRDGFHIERTVINYNIVKGNGYEVINDGIMRRED